MKDFTKSVLKTLAAFCFLGGLVAYAYYGEYRKGQKDEKTKEESRKIFAVKKENVASIESRVRGVGMMIAKENGHWRLAAPIQTDADQGAVDALAGAFDQVRIDRVVEEKPGDLHAFGLDNADMRIQVKMNDGTSQGITVGMRNDFDNTYYLMRDGDPRVYQAPTTSRFAFDKDLFSLREKKLFFADKNEEIFKADVTLRDLHYTLERDGDKWRVSGFAADRADDEEVTKILNALRSLRATAVAGETETAGAARGFDDPAAVIAIWKGPERAQQQVTVGRAQVGPQAKIYARRAGASTVWEIAEQILKDLDKKPFDLRYKKVLDFKREDVKKVVMKANGQEWTLEKAGAAGDAWEIAAPERAKAKPYKMNSVLYNLTNMKATEFAPEGATPKDYDLDNPNRSIALYDAAGAEQGRVEIGKATTGGTAVRSNVRTNTAFVERARLDEIPWSLADYREDAQAPAAGHTGAVPAPKGK